MKTQGFVILLTSLTREELEGVRDYDDADSLASSPRSDGSSQIEWPSENSDSSSSDSTQVEEKHSEVSSPQTIQLLHDEEDSKFIDSMLVDGDDLKDLIPADLEELDLDFHSLINSLETSPLDTVSSCDSSDEAVQKRDAISPIGFNFPAKIRTNRK